MKVSQVWTSSEIADLPAPKVDGEKEANFQAQLRPLIIFEFFLGHFFSLNLGKNSSGDEGSASNPFRCLVNFMEVVFIGASMVGAACLVEVTATPDVHIILGVKIILYVLTLKICLGSQEKYRDTIEQINVFDSSFMQTFNRGTLPGRDWLWACLWFFLNFTIPIPVLLFLTSQTFGVHDLEVRTLWMIGLFFHFSSTLQRSLLAVQFFALGLAIKCRFRCIKDLLEDELIKPRPSAAYIEKIRIHHIHLSILIDTMNDSACKRLIFPLLEVAAELLFIFYRYIYPDHFQIHPFILFNILADFVVVKIVTSVSERIVLESRMPLHVLRAVILTKISFLCQAQIAFFQDQILAIPVEISAGGFFYLDNKLLTEFVLLIMTYCTVILQLIPNDDEEDKEKKSVSANISAIVNSTFNSNETTSLSSVSNHQIGETVP